MQFIRNDLYLLMCESSHFVSDSLFMQEDCHDSSDVSLVLSPSSPDSVSQVRFFTLGVDKMVLSHYRVNFCSHTDKFHCWSSRSMQLFRLCV